MKNTRFFYSICYPDQEEIEYAEQPIDEAALLSLFRTFDWHTELRKPMDFYSPSLDFVGASDKHRLILSGLGEGQLEAFMVMYIVPNDEACSEPFDDQNYFRADTYSAEVSLSAADRLLDLFLAENYTPIKKSLSQEVTLVPTTAAVDRPVVETATPEEVLLPKTKARLTNPWERAIIREIKQDGGVARNDDFWNEPEWTLAKIGQRVLGYGMFFLVLFLLGLSIWEMSFRGLFLTILVGAMIWIYIKSDLGILLEKRRRRKERDR